jgi:hypothetical protein
VVLIVISSRLAGLAVDGFAAVGFAAVVVGFAAVAVVWLLSGAVVSITLT